MESDFAFFLPDTFIIITQRGGGEFSLQKSDFAVVAKVQQRERREVMMQRREHGESKQCLREQKRRLQSIGERWKKGFYLYCLSLLSPHPSVKLVSVKALQLAKTSLH